MKGTSIGTGTVQESLELCLENIYIPLPLFSLIFFIQKLNFRVFPDRN
jgi:hypothetical protein